MGERTVASLIDSHSLLINDGYRAKNNELCATGIPFARAGNVNLGFHFANADRFPEENLHKVGFKVSRPGDVVFTSKGTVGRFAFVQPDTQTFVYSPQLCFWRSLDTDVIAPRWLYYWMCSREFFEQYIEVSDQTDMTAYVNLRDQRKMRISLPPLAEQKAIAAVLSSLDDKIDLLHRQNKTIEAMAQTLFRQWFLEKAHEDWAEGCLRDVAENPRNSVKPGEKDHDTPYIGLEHVERKCIALYQSGSFSEVESNKYAFGAKDILFGKLRPYFHKVCFAPYPGVCSTDILVIRPKKDFYFAFCLFAFFQADVVEYANIGSGGTRMPRTNWEDLSGYPMRIPDDDTLRDFDALMEPLLNKIQCNLSARHTLEKLRDTLLPKLMSGEVLVDTGA